MLNLNADVLVNNPGVFLDNAMTEDYPIGDFDQTIHMNIRATPSA